MRNHYTWLTHHLPEFFANVGLPPAAVCGVITAHGDKCYSYRPAWEKYGIPFEHAVAIYLLSYYHPWSLTVRETDNGWVAPYQWVCDRYQLFKPLLPAVE